MLWEEHGNVEYDAKTEQTVCNVRGTCAARACAKGPMRDGIGVWAGKVQILMRWTAIAGRPAPQSTLYCKKRDHAAETL